MNEERKAYIFHRDYSSTGNVQVRVFDDYILSPKLSPIYLQKSKIEGHTEDKKT